MTITTIRLQTPKNLAMPARLGFSCNVNFDGIVNVSGFDPEDVVNMFV
jgi:hypothetical protein